MSEYIIGICITSAVTIAVVILQNRASTNKLMAEIEKNQAVTDTKVDELTREVREHNNFARRMPVLEEKVRRLEENE